MKIRFTNVTVKDVSDQIVGMPMTVYQGISADYEATDSDGSGNIAIDSGGLAPTDSYQPLYTGGMAQVEALTQTQIYNDFYPLNEIEVLIGVDSDGEELYETQIVGELWKQDLQETLDNGIERAQVAAGLITIESVDEIADQDPITI